MVKTLTIDIETYSTFDIPTSGVYKYVASTDFEIKAITVSIDAEVPITYDLTSGEELPLNIIQDILNDDASNGHTMPYLKGFALVNGLNALILFSIKDTNGNISIQFVGDAL